MRQTSKDLVTIYRRPFASTAAYRWRVWSVLTRHFFSRWIPAQATVLDLGCGYGEFINQILAGKKIAMDLNTDVSNYLNKDVELLRQDCSAEWPLPSDSLDVVFTSNFFEHLPSKAHLLRTLRQIVRCLKPGGMLIAMGPNIKYLPALSPMDGPPLSGPAGALAVVWPAIFDCGAEARRVMLPFKSASCV